ncbi:MAG TPA: glycosyltransferase, partial [Terrimicrobiaceae bacterium]
GLEPSKDPVLPPVAMEKIPRETLVRKTTQEIVVDQVAGKGWLVIPEAFHPDWKAMRAGKKLEIAKAYGAFLAIRVDDAEGALHLLFQPPAWYFACVATTLVGWLSFLGLLTAKRFSLWPASWRNCLLSAGPPVASLPLPEGVRSNRNPAGRVIVIIPTYNEASGINAILDQTLMADQALEIVVIDDNSPDKTAEAVRSHRAFGRRLHLVEREGKLGLGSAYKEGFRWALAQGFNTCIQIDADLSHDPADIPRLLDALESGADAAIGSRYAGGVRVLNWPQDRLFLSVGASKFVRTLTGLPLTDVTSGFKAVRCDALRHLDWNQFKTEGYGFQVELHFFLWKAGARFVEVPIVFTERRAGQTKMTVGIALEAVWRVLQLAIKR